MATPEAPQRDQDVVSYSAFAGVRSDVRPERFGQGDLEVGSNIDIDKSGGIARRAGRTEVVTGAAHSLWARDDLGLYVAGTTLNRLHADYSATGIRSGLTAGARMSYLRVNDSTYYTNGYERGELRADYSTHTWGLEAPPLPGVTVTVGLMPAGTYQYGRTTVRSDGQESGMGLAGSISVSDGSGLVFSWTPSTDADVLYTNLYLSPPNGDVLYRAQTVPDALVTATYQNSAQELTVPLETQFLGPPPTGHLLAYYRGMVLVAVDDTLYYSEPYAYSLFDLRKYQQFDGRITMLAPLEDREQSPESGASRSGLFVGTTKQCGVLVGASQADFQYVKRTDYGAVEGALDYVDGNLFGDNSAGSRQLPMFLTAQGLCVGLPDMEIKNLTRTRYTIQTGGQGAAYFNAGPNRFVAVSNL